MKGSVYLLTRTGLFNIHLYDLWPGISIFHAEDEVAMHVSIQEICNALTTVRTTPPVFKSLSPMQDDEEDNDEAEEQIDEYLCAKMHLVRGKFFQSRGHPSEKCVSAPVCLGQ